MVNEVCVINIGPKQRRRRMIFGALFGAVGVALAAWMLFNDASRVSRLATFVPFLLAGVGVFQAVDKV